MRFQEGDTVRYLDGKVDWKVKHVINLKRGAFYYIIESGMSGRIYTAFPNELRPWVPHER